MTLDNMVSALQELKGWKGLPYCIEEPMNIEGLGVVTEDLIENLIALVEFVEELPSNLRQYKENITPSSIPNDSKSILNGAINQGLDRAIGHIEDFVNTLENPEVAAIEAQAAVECYNNEYEEG